MTYRIVDERTLQVFARQSQADRFEFEIYPMADLLAARLRRKGNSAANSRAVRSGLVDRRWRTRNARIRRGGASACWPCRPPRHRSGWKTCSCEQSLPAAQPPEAGETRILRADGNSQVH